MPFKKGEIPKGAVPFKKGQIANPKGRPPKIYTILKKKGYSADDIKTVFRELSFYSNTDLKKLVDSDETPAILGVVASALRQAKKTGEYNIVKEIIAHVIGRPAQEIDLSGEITELIVIPPIKKE